MWKGLKFRVFVTSVIGIVLCGCSHVATQPAAETSVNYEGLEQVRARGLDVAFVRPGVQFGSYSGLIMGAPELAFRTPDRGKNEVSLTPVQKSEFRGIVQQHFQSELAKLESLELVEAPGPNVLRLRVRVQDISGNVRSNSRGVGGWSSLVLETAGEATLLLELYDSQSDEILARVIDAQAIEGSAVLRKDGNTVTKWNDIEKLCEHWATIARTRLNAVVERPAS